VAQTFLQSACPDGVSYGLAGLGFTNQASLVQQNSGVPLIPVAYDNYMLGWTGPPETFRDGPTPTVGEVYLQRVTITKSGTISNIYMFVQSAGTSMTSNENFAGIYTLSGANLVQQSVTTDISSVWTSTHVPRTGSGPGINLQTPVPVYEGQKIWVAQIFNSSGTPPSVSGGAAGYFDFPNIGAGVSNWASAAPPYTLAPNGFRFSSYSSGVTALPATIQLSLCNPDKAFWSGVG
jgi:hypothetical protein